MYLLQTGHHHRTAGPQSFRQRCVIGTQLPANCRTSYVTSTSSRGICRTAPRRIEPVMVEGHQCHRVGHAHRRLLLGKRFTATSPNGRFADGAAAITGKLLNRIEVHGKNLFYFFGGSPTPQPSAQQQQQQQLQSVDEDPLQPGAWDSDSEGGTLDTAAAAAAAGGPATPSKPLLASVGCAAAAALSSRSSRRHSRSLPAVTPAVTPAPGTPGNKLPAAAAATAAAAAAGAHSPSAAAAAADAHNTAAVTDSDVVVVHIHFGMSGAFRTSSLPGPDPTPTTRLRLVHEGTGLVAHLSAMTVAHGGPGLYAEKVSKLGPDSLRPDDDRERFWARMQSSKKPVGLLLMDQTAIAGVGNIYRAEILYKTGLHPEQPGCTVDRDTFEVLWGHCADLLQRGFVSGSILTVDPEDALLLGKPWTRRYIYNQRQCGRCRGPVKVWDMATRTVYCCETCQPLRLPVTNTTAAAAADGSSKPRSKTRSRSAPAGALDAAAAAAAVLDEDPAAAAAAAQLLHPSRLKSMAAAKVAKEFVSHCAPDDPTDLQPTKLTCSQLRDHLRALNVDTRGTKPQLVARLSAAKTWMTGAGAAAAAAAGGAPTAAAAAAAAAADSDTEVLVIDSDSGDEVDRAEDALAAALSVPPAKRRRHTATSAAQHSTPQQQQDGADTPAHRKPPPRRQRKMSAAAAAAAAAGAVAAAGGGDGASKGGIASTRAAEEEKAAAGENRAVEHVALQADAWTDQLMFGGDQQQQQQQQLDEDVNIVDTPIPRRPRRTGQRRQSLPLAL